MTKTTSSATTSHVTPVKKAPPGKLLIKNKLSRIGEEPRTPLNQSSPVSVLTATTALLMSSSQLTITTSSTQSDSSNLVRAFDFANLLDHTKKEPYLIDFCHPVDVKSKCLKYLSDARDLSLGQESQLAFLLNSLKLKDIQMAFIALNTIVGGAATTAFLPMPSTKAKLVKNFLCLIYNHKSMMINTDETSHR
jgi:hypothetical protein